ncbi:MAG: holo-ACP synthase [Ruminococcaceae bacterium]|nr:holo-ACP synthase [Oscillospiraceae bacterium]
MRKTITEVHMDISHGVDLERISRFDALIHKPSFMNGVYTDNERAFILSSARPVRTAASSFAAKEAIAKALGRGLYGLLPREIEVLRDEKGRPEASLLGRAAEQYGDRSISLSISYKDDYTVASCVLWRA